MKKIIKENAVEIAVIIALLTALIAVLAIGMNKFLNQEEPKEDCIIETIVNSYVNNRGHKVFVISDGTIAEIVAHKPRYKDYVQFYDREYNRGSSISENNPIFNKWLNAQVGDTVVKKNYYYKVKNPSLK